LRERNFHVLDLLIGLTQMMVEGEYCSSNGSVAQPSAKPTTWSWCIAKTASLFSACARLGAICGGADEATENRLGDFAWNLGMAFPACR